MKRAAIYFFYDKDKIVDDYNIYMLDDIRESVDYLIVVVNGSIDNDGVKKFNKVADEVFIRDNIGFDVWAYKEGINKIGWERLEQFDELILFNFTNYGPIYPFKEMFLEMNEREVDFWGITKHYGHSFDPYNKCKYGCIPEHIQSSFIAIRRNMLQSNDFRDYWDTMPMIHDYAEAICFHEAIFTVDFEKKGYKSSVYVDTDDLKDYSEYPLMLYPVELLKNRHCPIFKRKTFFNQYEEFLDVSCGQSAFELYEYLRKNTSYDMNLIWDNLLRTANMYDIKQRMQLNYILPTYKVENKGFKSKVALFLHIYYEDKIEYCKNYAASMPNYADIYISTSSQENADKIKSAFNNIGRDITVIVIENRGRDVSALLIGFKEYMSKYDYICFAHDKKSHYDRPYMIGESFSYQCFENVLANKFFVENIITTFDENPRLGLLVPPTPCHGTYYSLIGLEWQNNFQLTKEKAEEWGISVDIDNKKAPIAPFGTNFWFRKDALKLLINLNLEYADFPEEPTKERDGNIMHVIERMYPFAAQQAGFYTGWVMSDNFAKMEVTNLYKMLRDVNQTLFWNFGVSDRHTLMNCISVAKQSMGRIEHNRLNQEGLKHLVRKIIGEKLYFKLYITKQKFKLKGN